MTDILEVKELPNDGLKSPGCESFGSTWGQLWLLEGHLGFTWGVTWCHLGVTWGVTWGHLRVGGEVLGVSWGPKSTPCWPASVWR